MRFETVCFLYATSHFAVALTLIDYYRYRYFAAKVTALLILGSVLPHASFSALVLKSENGPHTDKHPSKIKFIINSIEISVNTTLIM